MSLTLHHQKIPDWFGEFVNRTEGNLAFLVGVDVFPDVPGVTLLGRTYIPDGTSNALVDGGAVGANAWIDHFAQVYAANPHVDYWIGPNEYVLWSQDHVDRFNAFHVQFIERMDDLGYRVCCGQINTGWPRLRTFGDPPPYPEALAPTLGALWAHEGLFSLHEYWPGLNDPTGNILRYRETRRELLEAGVVNLPNFVVTELGIDMPDPNAPQDHRGWRDFVDWPTYFGMLQSYAGELARDGYMLGASIFTVADDWVTFQINEPEAMPLADWIASDPEPPPPPDERARGFMVSHWSGEVDFELAKAEGYDYVMIRVSGPNKAQTAIVPDALFEQHYEQAGAAGLLRGGYYYLVADFGSQARIFAETIGERELELGTFCDIEEAGLTATKCGDSLEAADARTGLTTGVYINPNWLYNILGRQPWMEGRALWIAHYGVEEPDAPDWWPWTFWQNEGGHIGAEYCSLDVYAGTPEQLYSAYGNGGGEPVGEIRVYDAGGNERDWAWVVEQYGPLEITEAEPVVAADGQTKVIRLVELREKFGPATCVVKVLKVDGSPMVGVNSAWHYSTAPDLGDWKQVALSVWEPNADFGPTNDNGDVGHAMSEDSTYYPDRVEIGPYTTWILSSKLTSDLYRGIGCKAGTEHGHLDAVFQVVIIQDDPGPVDPEPGDDLKAVVQELARIGDVLERIERDGLLIRTS